jgi:eukaryotic-like serine/threonine-protein kinase
MIVAGVRIVIGRTFRTLLGGNLLGVKSEQLLEDRYRLSHVLGAGGMSTVWQAHDLALRRDVAVKVLAGPVTPARAGHDFIRAEARAVAQLTHPHVATVFDYGEFDDAGDRIPYVVMELLHGVSLAELSRPGPVRPDVAILVCGQVAGALAAAHDRGLVHRDVKPGNVMITTSGAKVFDFGIVAAVGAVDQTAPGQPILGTVAYVAPERLSGCPVSPASDVYALGLMLYQLITHEFPWHAETPRDIMDAQLFVEPRDLPDAGTIPAEVADLYRRCVAKDPSDRPSAAETAGVLTGAAGLSLRLDAERLDWGVGPTRHQATATTTATPAPAPSTVEPEVPVPHSFVPVSKRARNRRPAVFAALAAGLALFGVLLIGYAATHPANGGQPDGTVGASVDNR